MNNLISEEQFNTAAISLLKELVDNGIDSDSVYRSVVTVIDLNDKLFDTNDD